MTKDAGDPVERIIPAQYARAKELAAPAARDELVFLDISATEQQRKTLAELVLKVAATIDIPFYCGRRNTSVEDVSVLLKNGADKIFINSAAVKRPALIDEVSNHFGSQCLVVAIDAKQIDGQWKVHLVGGKVPTQIDLFDWAKEVEERGAGEILFTSMDHDGTKNGFANEALARLSTEVNIPIIVIQAEPAIQVILLIPLPRGKQMLPRRPVSFTFGEISVPDLKQLKQQQIAVRL